MQHRISKLGIVAHGDFGGVVLIDGEDKEGITLKTIESFVEDFKVVANFLIPDGLLIFEACVSGNDKDGSLLRS